MLISPKLAEDFKAYAAYHRTAGNKFCHFIGVPMIIVSVLGLFAAMAPSGDAGLKLLRWDGGVVVLILAGIWYFLRDWKLATPFMMVAFGLYFLGRTIPLPALVALFVVGWGFQLYGHWHFEKNRPALLENLKHILVAPLWIFAFILKMPL